MVASEAASALVRSLFRNCGSHLVVRAYRSRCEALRGQGGEASEGQPESVGRWSALRLNEHGGRERSIWLTRGKLQQDDSGALDWLKLR